MENRLISVIIPTYKRACRLDKAIDSALNQSYKNIEVIVVDDNNDGDEFRVSTESLIKKYKSDNRVHYVKHEINKGGSAARNTGISLAKGDYVAFLDDDDIFLETKIEKQFYLLKSNESYDAVCCAHISKYKQYVYRKNVLKEYPEGNYLFSLLTGENVLAAGSTLLIRKSALLKLNGFDESFKRHQDWEFLTRFFRDFKMKILNENLVVINVDGERNYPAPEVFLEIKQVFLKKFDDDILSLGQYKRNMIYSHQIKEIITVFWSQGRFGEGVKIAKKHKDLFSLEMSFIFIALYSILESKLKFMKALKYKILSVRYLRL